ncbi:MAG: hypothetical protein LBI16_05365, partial [Burkholderiales bacterium]|nr:hypothetical protein [Burkholderiales bacterium]
QYPNETNPSGAVQRKRKAIRHGCIDLIARFSLAPLPSPLPLSHKWEREVLDSVTPLHFAQNGALLSTMASDSTASLVRAARWIASLRSQ